MLLEDQVVDAVVAYLKATGWSISSFAHAHQHGDDIVAVKGEKTVRVEAKGAGSSRPGTKRYGSTFTRNQVGSHIGVAVMRALTWVSAGQDRAALALPDNEHHRSRIESVRAALHAAGIGVFWVDDARTVQWDGPWPLT